MKIFGFDIKRGEDDTTLPVSFAEPSNDDGAITVGNALGGFYNTILDMEGSAKTESNIITKSGLLTINFFISFKLAP